MALSLAAWRHRLCVIVGRDRADVLALGDHEEANAAQVVISTQEALRRTAKLVHSFDDAARFFYQGKRRAVVAWDEAFQFNRPVVLRPWATLKLAEAMRRQSPAAAEALVSFVVRDVEGGNGHCAVPDFVELGLDFHTLEADVADDDDAQAQAQALAVVTGKTGYVVNDNRGGVLVAYTPELPGNLVPLIVTDASAAQGVHHVAYEQMSQSRAVVRLQEASKSYSNMTVKVVPIAASRSAYRNKKEAHGRTLIEMAISYVRRVAPDPVLIVSYKNSFGIRGVKERTVAAAINARFTPPERERVKHLTWGRHTATNDHRTTPHVVLMGLNFLPKAAGHAASGAALDKRMQTAEPSDHPTDKQVEEMQRGMLRDSTLQALLRGNARQDRDGDCGPMVAVIPQAKHMGLTDEELCGMFPGVRIERDLSLLPPPKLKANLRDMERAVTAQIVEGVQMIPYPALRVAAGVKDAANFGKLIRKPEWKAFIASMGLEARTLHGRTMGLVRRGLDDLPSLQAA